jgi:hypothetical protein
VPETLSAHEAEAVPEMTSTSAPMVHAAASAETILGIVVILSPLDDSESDRGLTARTAYRAYATRSRRRSTRNGLREQMAAAFPYALP